MNIRGNTVKNKILSSRPGEAWNIQRKIHITIRTKLKGSEQLHNLGWNLTWGSFTPGQNYCPRKSIAPHVLYTVNYHTYSTVIKKKSIYYKLFVYTIKHVQWTPTFMFCLIITSKHEMSLAHLVRYILVQTIWKSS